MHVVSCYAPTRAASREEKTKFYDSISSILDGFPSTDYYILLGDFNACVGYREQSDDQWSNVKGPHGYGEMNDAGRELLALNEVMVCNTWYTEKNIHKATWQHPRFKQWHCIDYIIMKQKD